MKILTTTEKELIEYLHANVLTRSRRLEIVRPVHTPAFLIVWEEAETIDNVILCFDLPAQVMSEDGDIFFFCCS